MAMIPVADGPVPFPGTAEQAARNNQTHFMNEDGRCYDCDSKVSHKAYDYPCGFDVPRQTYWHWMEDVAVTA